MSRRDLMGKDEMDVLRETLGTPAQKLPHWYLGEHGDAFQGTWLGRERETLTCWDDQHVSGSPSSRFFLPVDLSNVEETLVDRVESDSSGHYSPGCEESSLR